jgi:hypothetical protein
LVRFEYLWVRRAQGLPSLQGQQRDLMASLLQASDSVVNVQLGSLWFTESDAAFLIQVGNFQPRRDGHLPSFGYAVVTRFY